MNVLFISPHLDDVALSCSKAVSSLRAQGFNIYALTLFANSAKPHASGDQPWEQVSYLERQKEDKNACLKMGAHVIHLDFLDAPYRLEEFRNFNSLFSHSAREFPTVIDALVKALDSHIAKIQPLKIFSPMGIGWHIDHLITFSAINFIKSSSPPEREFFFYEDRPYVFISHALELRLNELGYYPADFKSEKNLFDSFSHAVTWVTSPMARSALTSVPLIAKNLFTTFRRNIKSQVNHPTHAALNFVLSGNTKDLDFARTLAMTYHSQFHHLFGGENKFIDMTQRYSRMLVPSADYAERFWIL